MAESENMNQASGEDGHARARHRMIQEIRAIAREVAGDQPMQPSEKVLAVMDAIPRHRFVPEGETWGAYANHPLPIGHGQTISQPYIVALMTGLLALDKQQRVLEVGTGSGYQTAVLSGLAGKVYSMEIVGPLASAAAACLLELGCDNVEVRVGDGSLGWAEHAPYDAIIVTAAADHVPPVLLAQLKPGGRMVIPVGDWAGVQQLQLIIKEQDGTLHHKNIEPVRFVPLTGEG